MPAVGGADALWLVFSGALGGDTAESAGGNRRLGVLARAGERIPEARRAPHRYRADLSPTSLRLSRSATSSCPAPPKPKSASTAPPSACVRVGPLQRARDHGWRASAAPAARLQRRSSRRQRVVLAAGRATRPAPAKSKIVVEATGLNFRDLMWMLGLLPGRHAGRRLHRSDARASNAPGRSAQVGAAVKDLKVGDRVVAFAASAFSTHVTVPARAGLQAPGRDVACEAPRPSRWRS